MPGAIIHTVTHTVVNGSGDDLWRTLGPAFIAAIPAVAALWYNNRQSLRSQALSLQSNELAREQLRASSETANRQAALAERQNEIAEQQHIFQSWERAFNTWQDYENKADEYFTVIWEHQPDTQESFDSYEKLQREYEHQVTRMRFVFNDDVMEHVDALSKALEVYYVGKVLCMVAHAPQSPNDPYYRKELAAAEKAVDTTTEQLRNAVRAYTVHGLRSDGAKAPVPQGPVENP